MNKKNGNDNIIYSREAKELLKAIEEARVEWSNSRNFFDVINDSELIEYAIFNEQAAKAKYIYLIMKARKMNLKLDNYNVILKEVSSN